MPLETSTSYITDLLVVDNVSMLVVDVDVVVVEPAGVEPVLMSVLSFLKELCHWMREI